MKIIFESPEEMEEFLVRCECTECKECALCGICVQGPPSYYGDF